MLLNDEIIKFIFDFRHPNPTYNLQFLFHSKFYKLLETNRFNYFIKIHNINLLLSKLNNSHSFIYYKQIYNDFKPTNITEFRYFLNIYLGSYDEFYYISPQAIFDDIKQLSNSILYYNNNNYSYFKFIKSFKKKYFNIYALNIDINYDLFYSKYQFTNIFTLSII
jgi:hypothetical protein